MYNGIYNMDMTINFLIQATRVLSFDNYDEDELEMIYNFIINVDNEVLIDYNMNCTILIYNNDLELYIEIVDALTYIFEDREEYERCQKLQEKRNDAIIILDKNTI
jgi:hypothetical protein